MRPNPFGGLLLILFNVIVGAVVIYVVVDALDMTRQQSRRTEQAVARLSGSLDRLTEVLITRPVALTSSLASENKDNIDKQDKSKPNLFANSDLRDPDAAYGGKRVTSTIGFAGNLNAVITSEATTSTLWNQCIDSLAERHDIDLTRFEPKLAESWQVSDDGLTFTIQLRRNALWQPYVDPVTNKQVAAKPVTADDFLFYWQTIQNPKVPCDSVRNYYELLDRIEVVDDHTFKVIWKEPYSLAEEFTLGMQPLPRHYYRPDSSWDDNKFADEFTTSTRNQWIVGTGPYKISSWDKNTGIVLERDENYYGPKPYMDNVEIKVIAEPNVAFLEFKKGTLDATGLQPEQWHEETPDPPFKLVTPDINTAIVDSAAWDMKKKAGELPTDYKFEKYQYPSPSWAYIGYNMRRPLFSDAKVRRALSMLVNRERILDEVFLGLGRVVSGPFVPQSPYYNHDVAPLPFDPEAAKKLLAEAGWIDHDLDGILDKDLDGSGKYTPFSFTFIIPASSVLIRKWATIIEQDMRKAGISANIKPIDWSVYLQALDEWDFDVCSLLWTGGVEGDPYQIWHSSQAKVKGGSNYVGYVSPEADALIEEGRRTLDKEKRYAIYRRFHELLANDQPYTFLIAPTSTVALQKYFNNVRVYSAGMDTSLQWSGPMARRNR